MSNLEDRLAELVLANHILAHEGVVDAFGHVSMRHPERNDRYFLSCSRSPELVSIDDLIEFDLDSNPIDQQGRSIYLERPIHGEIYKARPDINSVVHNHAHEVLPFTVTEARLRAMIHVAAPIGEAPVWDIDTKFGGTDLLVRTLEQGEDLAKTLGNGRIVLMRGHGAVTVGRNIREAVLVAVYMMVNAKVQMDAMRIGTPKYLSAEEVERSTETTFSAMGRAWEYWARRAQGDV